MQYVDLDLRIFPRVEAINICMPYCCSGWQKSNVCYSHYQELLPLSFICRWKTVMCIEAGWQALTNTNPHDSADCGAVRGSGVCDGVIRCLSACILMATHYKDFCCKICSFLFFICLVSVKFSTLLFALSHLSMF